jgi:hypothetical protein
MSLFSIYLGYLAYGGFRGQTLIPQNAGENDICGLTGRKMLTNPDGSGAGNFACEGCSDTVNVVDWDIANIQTSTEGRYSEGGVEGGLSELIHFFERVTRETELTDSTLFRHPLQAAIL